LFCYKLEKRDFLKLSFGETSWDVSINFHRNFLRSFYDSWLQLQKDLIFTPLVLWFCGKIPKGHEKHWVLFFVFSKCFSYPLVKHTKSYGKSLFLMGKSTISMAIFNSYFDITRGYFYLWQTKMAMRLKFP